MTATDWGLIVVFIGLVALIVWLLVQDEIRERGPVCPTCKEKRR